MPEREVVYVAIDKARIEKLERQLNRMEAALNVLLKPKRQDWITVQECSKLVGRSESTVSRWVREGRIEAKSVGGQRLVRNPC